MIQAAKAYCFFVLQPTLAQFGLGKKKGGSFQELNEQAKKMIDGDAGLDLSKLMGDIDPKMLEDMAGLGAHLDEVMKVLADMSPEELEKQMKDAMQMLQSGDMMQNLLQNQGEILKTLEETGQVDPEELAKFKTDPEYFEQKMKDSFEQMASLFSDPEVLKMATKSMAGLSDLYNNPDKLGDLMSDLFKDFEDDEKIEEVRKMLLESPDLGSFGELFNNDEMKEILKDPVKWRETVKEGQGLLQNGAGVGEL